MRNMQKSEKEFENNAAQPTVRLDKWLWAARFYKTRSLAKAMIDGGKVHYNQQRVKPNKEVKVGDSIRLSQGNVQKEIIILGVTEKRGPAPDAQKLYKETEASITKREQIAEARKYGALSMPNPERRPTKKERRELIEFKSHQ